MVPFNERHSEEVGEIISRPPHWVAASGTSMLFGLLLLAVLGCWLIQSPDIISVPVTLVSKQYDSAGQKLSATEPVGVRLYGIVKIPQNKFGKIEEGQKVLIKLDAYPYREYGILKGKLGRIAPNLDADGQYQAYVSLPALPKTHDGRRLAFTDGMRGSADIITRDRRLIQRLTSSFRNGLQ